MIVAKEEFTMEDNIHIYIKERAEYLEKLVKDKTEALKSAPAGALRITHSKQSLHYYCRTDPKNTTGKYIKKEDVRLASLLAQKDYDQKVLALANKELTHIRRISKYPEQQKVEYVYDALSRERRKLVNPISLSDEDFVAEWEAVSWQKKEVGPGIGSYFTGKKERVRSKSEILIADMLARFSVPYRYEYPLTAGGRVFYPDFTALNVRRRIEVIWEHFGMMDQKDYAQGAVSKIEMLEFAGYYPGRNFIMTFETDKTPLNTKLIEDLIRKYLL